MDDRDGESIDTETDAARPATQAHEIVVERLADQSEVSAAQARVPPNSDAKQENVLSYKEIDNLLKIIHSPIHKLALEEWQRREKYLGRSVTRMKGQSIDLTNQIYSIFGIFAVFQGVVLTAVSQLKQTERNEGMPVCGKIWFPIMLSAFVTLTTSVGIWHQYKSLESLESTIDKDNHAIGEFIKYSDLLRKKGPEEFKFPTNIGNSNLTTGCKFMKNRTHRRCVLVILSVSIFTGICVLSYFVILCDTRVIRNWDKGLHG